MEWANRPTLWQFNEDLRFYESGDTVRFHDLVLRPDLNDAVGKIGSPQGPGGTRWSVHLEDPGKNPTAIPKVRERNLDLCVNDVRPNDKVTERWINSVTAQVPGTIFLERLLAVMPLYKPAFQEMTYSEKLPYLLTTIENLIAWEKEHLQPSGNVIRNREAEFEDKLKYSTEPAASEYTTRAQETDDSAEVFWPQGLGGYEPPQPEAAEKCPGGCGEPWDRDAASGRCVDCREVNYMWRADGEEGVTADQRTTLYTTTTREIPFCPPDSNQAARRRHLEEESEDAPPPQIRRLRLLSPTFPWEEHRRIEGRRIEAEIERCTRTCSCPQYYPHQDLCPYREQLPPLARSGDFEGFIAARDAATRAAKFLEAESARLEEAANSAAQLATMARMNARIASAEGDQILENRKAEHDAKMALENSAKVRTP